MRVKEKKPRVIVYRDGVFLKSANSPNFFEVHGAEVISVEEDITGEIAKQRIEELENRVSE